MNRMRIVQRLVALGAIAAISTSCGKVVRTGSSPVYVVIDTLQAAQGNHPSVVGGTLNSDVLTIVTTPPPCSTTTPCPTVFNDVGTVKLRVSLKDIGNPGSPA